MPPTYAGAVVVRPQGHDTAMAPPNQPCAAVVPPPYRYVVKAQPPGQRATMAPAQQLKDFHSDAPPWCYSCGTHPAPTEPGGT